MKHFFSATLAASALMLGFVGQAPAHAEDDIWFQSVSQENPTFYPLVNDGYKDETNVFVVGDELIYRVDWAVTTIDGEAPVASGNERNYDGYANDFYWNGDKDGGGKAAAGAYNLRITYTDYFDVPHDLYRTITVATKTSLAKKTVTKKGTQTSSTSKRGNCTKYGYDGPLTLDCFDYSKRAYIVATYKFRTPASARDLAWSVTGHKNCCDRGIIKRTGKRVSKTRFVVRVKVTGTRSYDVRKVNLTYKYKKTI